MKKNFFLLIVFLFATVQLPSHAYLDPGTGSMVFQIIIATVAGAICWIKIQWNSIKGFLANICSKKK